MFYKPRSKKLKKFLLAIILPQMAGIIGSLFTVSAVLTWYSELSKPSFNPPSWLFGPVWVSLYFLMGVSCYLIWKRAERGTRARRAVWLFWVQLFFNAIWSIIFFGAHDIALALVDLLILWLLVIILTIKFWKISKPAGALLIPYLLWTSFAVILNTAIWLLN